MTAANERAAPDGTSGPGVDQPRLDAPLPRAAYLGGLAVIAVWVVFWVSRAHIAFTDRAQQYGLVLALRHGDLVHAFTRTGWTQAAPPGFGFFALPFTLVLGRFHGGGHTGKYWAYTSTVWPTLVLLAGSAIALLRSMGGGRRSPRELLQVAAVVGAGTTFACITEAFHPGDLLAVAGVLAALAAVSRRRFGWAVVFLAAALLMKQWVILPIGVIACLHDGRERKVLGLGPLAGAGIVMAPFVVANPKASFDVVSAASVIQSSRNLIGHLPPLSPNTIALEARLLPIVLVAGLCRWLVQREVRFTPDIGLLAIAVAFLIRPPLDPGGFVYYSAPGFIVLALCGRRWVWPTLVWAAAMVLALLSGNPHRTISAPRAAGVTAMMLAALAVALVTLRGAVNRRPGPGVQTRRA